MRSFTSVDLFCGAGGEGIGIEQACDEAGLRSEMVAIDHDELAIESHRRNCPEAKVIRESIQNLDPAEVVPGGKLNLLWASPECFVAGTLILTSKGLLPIEQVRKGDLVLTHTGSWKPVTRTFLSEGAPTVLVKGYGHYGIETTQNHPFYSKRVTKRYPGRRGPEGKRPGTLKTLVENLYWPLAHSMAGKLWATPLHHEPLPIPPCPGAELSDDFFYFVGRWLGDGSINKGDVEISCGYAEAFSFAARMVAHPLCLFDGSTSEFRTRDLPTARLFVWGNASLVRWLCCHFGKGAKGKHVPAWCLGMQAGWRRALLNGYMDAGGHRGPRRSMASSVSKALAIGVRLLATTLGHTVSLYKTRGKNGNTRGRLIKGSDAYRVAWTNDPRNKTTLQDRLHVFTPVREAVLTGRTERVYNLEVAGDESYVADGIIVHNCIHHSKAAGGRPKCNRSRSSAWMILRWLRALVVEHLIIENVPEFQAWGPLDEDGRPIPERKGELFMAFMRALSASGYHLDRRTLVCADYGAPTMRERLFIQGNRVGDPIVWPEATHTEDGEWGDKWLPAASIVDWGIPGRSIFGRKKPLSPKTIARIRHGARRYWGKWADPFLQAIDSEGKDREVQLQGLQLEELLPFRTVHKGTGKSRDLCRPVPAVIAGGTVMGLAQPFVTIHKGTSTARDIELPAPTFTSGASGLGLVQPFVIPYYGSVNSASITAPLGTVTTVDRFALIEGAPLTLDIHHRMFKPHELSTAQGFPKDAWFAGNQRQQVKQIGNAVPCPVAKALVKARLGRWLASVG